MYGIIAVLIVIAFVVNALFLRWEHAAARKDDDRRGQQRILPGQLARLRAVFQQLLNTWFRGLHLRGRESDRRSASTAPAADRRRAERPVRTGMSERQK